MDHVCVCCGAADGWTFRTVFPGDITSLNHAEKEDFKAKLAAEVVASSHGLITPQELQVNIFGGSIIATTTLQKTVSMMSIHKCDPTPPLHPHVRPPS